MARTTVTVGSGSGGLASVELDININLPDPSGNGVFYFPSLEAQPPLVSAPNSPLQFLTYSMASGDNTITVPTGATYAVIMPPAGNALTLKTKGNAGDTGIKIHKTAPTPLALDPTQASFILNCANTIAGFIIGWI